MTMNKAGLVAAVATRSGRSANSVKPIVDDVFAAMSAQLATGAGVRIYGFGTFTPHKVHEHPGVDPRDGRRIVVSARSKVRFKASPELKDRL